MISKQLQDLLLQYCEPENDLLKKINKETHLKTVKPRMLSGHYQGRLLSFLSKIKQPNRILEIGTFTGYATLCLAEGLTENGIIYTLDINQELEEMVRTYFEQSGFNNKIKYILGDATQSISQLKEVFDIVFIDADKKNNATYYDLIFDRVPSGGLIIVDNVLWDGKVLQKQQDKDTANITLFNKKIANDNRVEKMILPIRDGIFVIRKK